MIFKKIITKQKRNISLFEQLALIVEKKNLFALDDKIKFMWGLPRYYKKLINLILWGVEPQMISHSIINDFTTLHTTRRNRKKYHELVICENIIGFGIFYLQMGFKPEQIRGELNKRLLYMEGTKVLVRNFKGSFYDTNCIH